MEEFEVKAMSSSLSPHLLIRYVDDTFVIQQAKHSHQFLQHFNSLDPHIQFIMEDPMEDGSIPILDTLVSLGPNNTLTISANRNQTHMDQYLNWDSNHNLLAQNSVYNILAHNTRVVYTSQPAHKQQQDYIR